MPGTSLVDMSACMIQELSRRQVPWQSGTAAFEAAVASATKLHEAGLEPREAVMQALTQEVIDRIKSAVDEISQA